MRRPKPPPQQQLQLPLASHQPSNSQARPMLRIVRGEGAKGPARLDSKDAVIRVLLEAGADLLLRRISSARAEEIRRRVDEVMTLFDRVDASPGLIPTLKRRLDQLELRMRETRGLRASKFR